MKKRHNSAAIQNVAANRTAHLSLAFWSAAVLRRSHYELASAARVLSLPSSSCFRQTRGDWRTRFVPVCVLLVGMGDLQNAGFIQRFA